jgi:hypothetical protein
MPFDKLSYAVASGLEGERILKHAAYVIFIVIVNFYRQ